ncbi:MAG: hypothetical protein RLY60_1789, partial [Pseudomonadota bacterium]
PHLPPVRVPPVPLHLVQEPPALPPDHRVQWVLNWPRWRVQVCVTMRKPLGL